MTRPRHHTGPVDTALYARALDYARAGVSVAGIAEELGLSATTIQRWLRRASGSASPPPPRRMKAAVRPAMPGPDPTLGVRVELTAVDTGDGDVRIVARVTRPGYVVAQESYAAGSSDWHERVRMHLAGVTRGMLDQEQDAPRGPASARGTTRRTP